MFNSPNSNRNRTVGALAITGALLFGAACSSDDSSSAADSAELESLRTRVAEVAAGDERIDGYLEVFDTLDFQVFSNQEWDRVGESHADDIKVVWPDGRVTVGIDEHIDDMKALFVHAPDTRILEHPIGFGDGNMTVVEGVFEGTFTEPLPDGNGGVIEPTGLAFKMPMATIGIWEDGVMIEEHLFWDNATYAAQIGLG